MALSWCKVASNLDSHPKIRRAGHLGREVFLFALRRNAEPGNPIPGRIAKEELADWYVADQLMISVTDAVTGVTAAVTAGLLRDDGDFWVIVAWKDGWGRDNGSGAERTARWRENKKLRACDSGGDKRDVTRDSGDSGDTEERRGEENRSIGAEPRKPEKRKTRIPADWQPRPEERDRARELGVDCERETEQFRDHYAAKGEARLDWDASFRTWLRNAVKFSRQRAGLFDRSPQEPSIRRIKELK